MSYPVRRWPQGRSAFADLDALRAELGRMLGSTVGGWGGAFSPDVDVEEGDQAWTVTVRLPGVAPEEVVVELDGRDLLVRARHEREEDGGGRRTAFRYRVTVPNDISPEDVDATMDHGLLTVRLPRRGLPQGRRIAINSRSGIGTDGIGTDGTGSTATGAGAGATAVATGTAAVPPGAAASPPESALPESALPGGAPPPPGGGSLPAT